MAKKRYRVVAEDSVVAGHKTGEEFELDCEDEGISETALLASGAVEDLGKVPSVLTKAELLAKVEEFGIDARPNATKAELDAAVSAYESEG